MDILYAEDEVDLTELELSNADMLGELQTEVSTGRRVE